MLIIPRYRDEIFCGNFWTGAALSDDPFFEGAWYGGRAVAFFLSYVYIHQWGLSRKIHDIDINSDHDQHVFA